MKLKKIRDILLKFFMVVGLSGLAAQALAIPSGWTPPNVTLRATLNNAPAMSPVRWSVYRVDNGSTVPFRTYNNRHSLAIALPPGRYVAEANLNSVSRSRIFDVSSRATNNVVLAMD